MATLVEFQVSYPRVGRAAVDPAAVVSISSLEADPDSVYIELTSGNSFRVVGSIESVLEALKQ